MKEIVFNEDNLNINEIEEQVTKARALIINNNNEILLAQYNGVYLLPGGSIEQDEDTIEGLYREIKEETGIDLSYEEYNGPFMVVNQLSKNYPKREGKFISRLSKTYYSIINTDKDINRKAQNLTSDESKSFSISYINIDEAIDLVANNNTTNPRNKYFKRETLTVLSEYKKLKLKNK